MIKIKVEDYCHNCPEFSPYIGAFGNGGMMLFGETLTDFGDTVVHCENEHRCRVMMEYLKSKISEDQNVTE